MSKQVLQEGEGKETVKKAMKKFVPTTRTVPLWFYNTQMAEDITSSSGSSDSSSDTENTSSSSDTVMQYNSSTSACNYNQQRGQISIPA